MPKNIEAKKTSRGRRLAVTTAGGISLALVSLPPAALALDSQLVWQGIITVTAATTACASIEGAAPGGAAVAGAAPGDVEVSIFRPKIASTDTATFLSWVYLRSAFTLENTSEATVHQMHGAGNFEGFAANSRAKFFDYTGTYSLTVTPATVVASTPVVTITGKITNWFDVPGCNVSFTGVYGPRVD